MNIQQRQNILDAIAKIETVDIIAVLNVQYPNEPDATKIGLGKYNAAELIQMFKRMLDQLKEELNSGLKLLLPASQNFNNDYGSVNIESDLNEIHNYLVNNDVASIPYKVDSLVYYQIINGFWDKKITRVGKTETDYKKLLAEAEVISQRLRTFVEQNEKLVEKYNSDIDRLSQFISEKNQEFGEISNKENDASAQLDTIKTIISEMKVLESDAKNIHKNQQSKLEEINNELSVQRNKFKDYSTETSTLTEQLTKSISDNTTTLDDVKNTLDGIKKIDTYLESKKIEIEKLAGFAADSSLGHSFNSRKGQLTKSVTLWLIVLCCTVVVVTVWLTLIYSLPSLRPHTGNVWLDVVLYALKSALAFIVLGFAIRQYSKERNLQEEYAFKEAIAVTINAYADQLQGEKDEDRRKMIMQSIEKVYSQPKIHTDNHSQLLGFRKKDVKELIEKMMSEVKDVVSKEKK